jgi:excinuclease ABC subunit A
MNNSYLHIRGCREHNLKNISLNIPKQCIVALVGISGSGKSSLAFDTIHAEGQRRYLEHLSPQIRSTIKQLPKPDVELIEGLAPTLAIGRGNQRLYARGNVATYTDIYDFLALLYANIGEQHSPTTGKKLVRHSRQEIIDIILNDYPPRTRIQILSPCKIDPEGLEATINKLLQMGYIRMKIDGQDWMQDDTLPSSKSTHNIDVIVDRLEIADDVRERLGNSIETAMDLSRGILKVQEGREGPVRYFTEIYVCPETSHSFAPLGTADFNFNSPHGACPLCRGVGGQPKVQEHLIFWDAKSPLTEQLRRLLDYLPKRLSRTWHPVWDAFLKKNKVGEETPLENISPIIMEQVLRGSSQELSVQTRINGERKVLKSAWKGLIPLFDSALLDKKNKIETENLPFVEWETCFECRGYRLKPESLSCLVKGKGIHELCEMPVSSLIKEISRWRFRGGKAGIASEILPHIQSRLNFLERVGLGYLQLSRDGTTLSDGETHRIQLASQIGAKLSGILYILDEPSLGLHRQDIQYLYEVILELKNLGNTVILVEHEPGLISHAEHIIELGPQAGLHGGNITFQGTYRELLKNDSSLTGLWLSGRIQLDPPVKRKIKKEKLRVSGVTMHNLNNFSVDIPLNSLVGFCGVSGSGKSTLVTEVIGEEMLRILNRGDSNLIRGYEKIKRLVVSEKQTESFSKRSMPATFVQIMTPIRNLFAEVRLSKARGYTAARFGLNKPGGRCEACEGMGQVRVGMQLMPDIFIPCEVCQGMRYNYETLQVTWKDLNISQILNLSIEEAYPIFQYIPAIADKLELMSELGLEYLTLGQASNTLSSGEIQRLRLVADLATKSLEPTLYILDEPSAGLHFEDIAKLLRILNRLVEKGHSIFVVEHHLAILSRVDWLIELGPEGGPGGGNLLFEGTPDKIYRADTPTGRVMSEIHNANW